MSSTQTKKQWQSPSIAQLGLGNVAGTSKVSSAPGTVENLFHVPMGVPGASMQGNHLQANPGHVIANSVPFSSPSVIDVQGSGGDVGPS